MKILKSLKPHVEIALSGCPYPDFQKIRDFAPILYDAKKGEQLLITLTIPDTWCDKAGERAWFAIKVNNSIVATGLYSCGMDLQRVPISLQAVIEVDSDKSFVIEAVWCNGSKTDVCHIGYIGDSILTVIVNNELLLDSTASSQEEDSPGHPVIWSR